MTSASRLTWHREQGTEPGEGCYEARDASGEVVATASRRWGTPAGYWGSWTSGRHHYGTLKEAKQAAQCRYDARQAAANYQPDMGGYTVIDDGGKAVGFVCKRDDGWHSWLHQPRANVSLGTFGTRRDAAAEIFIELSGGTWQ